MNKIRKIKKNITIERGRADAWGFGAAVVFTEGLVVAFGLWYLEINW